MPGCSYVLCEQIGCPSSRPVHAGVTTLHRRREAGRQAHQRTTPKEYKSALPSQRRPSSSSGADLQGGERQAGTEAAAHQSAVVWSAAATCRPSCLHTAQLFTV